MKKKKQYNVWVKVRSALRDIHRYSPMHRDAVKAVMVKDAKTGNSFFDCPLCKTNWHQAMATVDHLPACGPLTRMEDVVPFMQTLFYGKVRVICKICHKAVTKEQRKKK